MPHSITKTAILMASAILLAGCNNLLNVNDKGTEKSAQAEQKMQQTASKVANLDLAALEKQAQTLQRFEYITADNHYQAYIGAQVELVKSKDATFFYQHGKLVAVQDKAGAHQFDSAGKLMASTGNLAADKVQALVAQGNKLAKMLSYTAADKRQVNTGDEAKLNYLCVTKIRQVAQTDRVFRSSANTSGSSNRLVAEMRLNGNQFYKMDCQLEGDRVAKLSLIKK